MAGRTLLAVTAHPDDETFLLGGTLTLLVSRGWSAFVLTVTDGEQGRRGTYADEELSPAAFGALRREELKRACRRLGARVLPTPACPDAGVEGCADRLTRVVREWILELEPHVVVSFGPDGVSGHRDHVAVGRITDRATRAVRSAAGPGGRPIEALWVLASDALPECCRTASGEPVPPATLRVHPGLAAERKLLAMGCYESQAHLQPVGEADRQRVREAPERFHRVPHPRTQRTGSKATDARSASGGGDT